MTFFKRLLGFEQEPKEIYRPLWNAAIAAARDPRWYRDLGAVDSQEGRFDMLTAITAITMIRLERDPENLPKTARLTELFAEDIEGQLREQGIGDPALGKHMGRMMEALGGRIGAYRAALNLEATNTAASELAETVQRNIHLSDGALTPKMAENLRLYFAALTQLSNEALLSGEQHQW